MRVIEVLIAFLGVGLLVWLYGLYNLVDNARRSHRLSATPWQGGDAPRVSVVVPARDEAHQIERCLESLRAQDYPAWELVVVDDRSEDGTAETVARLAERDSRIRLVSGAELPPGWMGKSWANHQGVEHATGEWLFFTDADTWHDPAALSTLVRFALDSRADMVSTAPFLVCDSFWEKVVQPGVVLSVLLFKPLRVLEDPRKLDTLANGQCILIRRKTYEQAGGHAAIRSSVVDDISLATLVQQSGATLRLPQGASLVKVRMYTSLSEIWSGWSKNFYGAIKSNMGLALFGTVIWFAMSVLPWFCLPWFAGVLAGHPGHPLLILGLGLAAADVLLAILVRAVALRPFCRLSPVWMLSHPLTYTMLSLFMLNSLRRGLLGLGPVWKGRTYPGMHA